MFTTRGWPGLNGVVYPPIRSRIPSRRAAAVEKVGGRCTSDPGTGRTSPPKPRATASASTSNPTLDGTIRAMVPSVSKRAGTAFRSSGRKSWERAGRRAAASTKAREPSVRIALATTVGPSRRSTPATITVAGRSTMPWAALAARSSWALVTAGRVRCTGTSISFGSPARSLARIARSRPWRTSRPSRLGATLKVVLRTTSRASTGSRSTFALTSVTH